MKLIVANLKSSMLKEDLDQYINYLKNNLTNKENIILIPSNIYLNEFLNISDNIGAQNVSVYESSNHTGSITAKQLKSLGIKYCIIGHMEVRDNYQETDELIALKAGMLIGNDIIPILCVGETKEQKETNQAFDVIAKQIDSVFKTNEVDEKIIIAYEPAWAIGSGLVPSATEITEMISYIKDYVADTYGEDIKILYGGSVNQGNMKEIMNISLCDGVLVGTSSFKADTLLALTRDL